MGSKRISERIDHIIGIFSKCEEMDHRTGEKKDWDKDIKVLEEIKDILHDYDQQAAQLQAMIQKYEQADRPVRNGDIYTCPECGHRVNPRHTHCHRCGKKLGR